MSSNYCDYCDGAKPLITDKGGDRGIALQYPAWLLAYGFDVHGSGSDGLLVKIQYCPICGKRLQEDT